MSPSPKLSIIVPAYNAERYLAECLESITAQVFTDYEVICVNDGSTDGTLEIMNTFAAKDGRFRVLDKPNTGYGDSMNIAISQACGKWIGSVESDDIVPPHAYQRMVQVAEDNQLDFVKADRTIFSEGMLPETGKRSAISRNEANYGIVLNPSEDPWGCGLKPGQPGLYRAEFLSTHGILHNDSPGASFQDTGLWAQAIFNGKRALAIRENLYYVRKDNPSSSSLDTMKVFEICNEFGFVRDKALGMPSSARERCLKSAAAMRLDCYRWNEQRLPQESREPFVRREHEEFCELEELGEIDHAYFEDAKWKRLRLIVDAPMEYYARYCFEDERLVQAKEEAKELKRRLECAETARKKASKKLDELKKSRSWKLGRAITYAPRKLKEQLNQ